MLTFINLNNPKEHNDNSISRRQLHLDYESRSLLCLLKRPLISLQQLSSTKPATRQLLFSTSSPCLSLPIGTQKPSTAGVSPSALPARLQTTASSLLKETNRSVSSFTKIINSEQAVSLGRMLGIRLQVSNPFARSRQLFSPVHNHHPATPMSFRSRISWIPVVKR